MDQRRVCPSLESSEKTRPLELCERGKAQLELTPPLPRSPFPNRSPIRTWLSTDILDNRWDPGIPSCSWWVTRPTKGQMVFMVGREARVVQQPPYYHPTPTPDAAFYSFTAREDTTGLDFTKPVYSHFRKTSLRTGTGLPTT